MSDEEAEYIRDGFRSLAEVIYEKWMVDIKTTSCNKLSDLNSDIYGKPNESRRSPREVQEKIPTK